MAAGKSHEQRTIPVNYEAQKAPNQEQKPKEPLTFPEFILFGFTAVGGYYIVSFLFEEAVNFIKELGQ